MSVLSGGFDDFEVLIAAEKGDGVYPVTVIESPAGQANGEFLLPMSQEELQAAIASMQTLDTDEAMLTDFGIRLFSALFNGDIRTRYAESVGIAREKKGLRIRLHIDPPELAGLPWELLYDREKREFLCLSKRALITRYLHVPRPPSPLGTGLPLRILITIAAPHQLPELDSEAETATIKTALARSVKQNLIQFDVLHNATTRALRDALMEDYHILHFIGHGSFDEGVGRLAFENDEGDTDLMSGRTLGTLLKNSSVRLVVLNACQSAQNTQTVRAFTGVGPALVSAGIPAVTAMQFVVGDDSALVFAQDFYAMLSRYLPIDECVSRAREGLMLEAGVENVDWATPVLFLRAPDGVIFVPEGVDPNKDDDQILENTGYFRALTTALPETAPPAAELPQEKEMIKHLWALADCPTYRRWADPHEAISRWVAPCQEGYWDELDRQDVKDVIEDEPVTVILGDPGMGKSAILELLVFRYAEQALRANDDAVIPVFVKLSQYGGEDSLVPLIRVGLNRHGQINLSPENNDAATQSLLAKRRFIFLIDGLNEIPGDETQRTYGIDVVRRFLKEHPQHKYVITCRTSAYDDQLQEWKQWTILPHSDQDVKAFLVRRLGEARGSQLYGTLPERMRELARTPLLLSVLLDELQSRGDQAAKQLGPLFTSFSSRMLSAEEALVPTENKRTLLASLAFAMKLDQTKEYTLDQTMEAFGDAISKARLWEIAPQDVLDDLIASGLIRTGSTAHIAFSHSYCQDYYAAVALQGKLDRGEIDWEELTGDLWWHESILFLVTMVEQPVALIEQLLDYDPLLAAECLLEAEDVNGTLGGQIGEALAQREKIGSDEERERATELLTKLQATGMAPGVVRYRQEVGARLEEDPAYSTSIGMLVRGHLAVQSGPLAGLCFPLLDGTITLGRSRQANITLREKSVSRRHAEIKVNEQEFAIRDLGSTNGTQVNGLQITSWRELYHGDKIQLGDLPLTLQVKRTD